MARARIHGLSERQAARPEGLGEGLFVRWPLLAPTPQDWAHDVLG